MNINVINILNTIAFMDVMAIVNVLAMLIVSIFYFSQNFFTIVAPFSKKDRFEPAKKYHKFAYLICAHDEELVIANLIQSIRIQYYPQDLIDIFVVCDNCIDKTREIATQLGCYVIERNDLSKIGKCYALDYGLKTIINEYHSLNIEAFLIFDADNLVSKDYTNHMNDAFDSGLSVCTSYRNSKNFTENWMTAGAGMIFLRECSVIHRGRRMFNIGTYVSGTGFFVSYELIKQLNGWPFDALIEDVEFSIWCANNNVKIGYNHQAIIYDEQTSTHKDSFNQRMRWCRGNHQCWFRHGFKLLKNAFKNKNFACIELFSHTAPIPAFTFLWTVFYTIILSGNAIVNNYSFNEFMNSGGWGIVFTYIIMFGIAFFYGAVSIIINYKRLNCKISRLILIWLQYPFVMFLLLMITVITLFVKVEWKKIDHSDSKNIEELEGVN